MTAHTLTPATWSDLAPALAAIVGCVLLLALAAGVWRWKP